MKMVKNKKAFVVFALMVLASIDLLYQNCGSGGGGGGIAGNTITCGSGLHRDGNGICQIDEALGAVSSQSSAQRWHGSSPLYGGYTFYYDVTFTVTSASGQNPAGTGLLKFWSSQTAPPAAATAITWSEGPDTASIQISGGPHGLTQITNINPNGGSSSTSFIGNVTDTFGSLAYTFTLTSGALSNAGLPVTIATGQNLFTGGANYMGQGLVADGTNLYWITSDGFVRYCANTGGTVYTLASGFTNIGGFTSDSNNLYWTAKNTALGFGVFKMAKSGGVVTQIVPMSSFANSASLGAIVTDGNNVYFSVITTTGGFTNQIATASTVGVSPTILVSSGATSTASVQWGTFLALDFNFLYFDFGTTLSNRALAKIPLGGGSSTTIASGIGGAIAVDSTNLYWFDGIGIQKIPLNGGPSVELIANAAPGGYAVRYLAVDATNVYFGYEANGGPLIVPITPASAPTTATNPNTTTLGNINSAGAYAIDTNNIYWGDYSASAIYALPK